MLVSTFYCSNTQFIKPTKLELVKCNSCEEKSQAKLESARMIQTDCADENNSKMIRIVLCESLLNRCRTVLMRHDRCLVLKSEV